MWEHGLTSLVEACDQSVSASRIRVTTRGFPVASRDLEERSRWAVGKRREVAILRVIKLLTIQICYVVKIKLVFHLVTVTCDSLRIPYTLSGDPDVIREHVHGNRIGNMTGVTAAISRAGITFQRL